MEFPNETRGSDQLPSLVRAPLLGNLARLKANFLPAGSAIAGTTSSKFDVSGSKIGRLAHRARSRSSRSGSATYRICQWPSALNCTCPVWRSMIGRIGYVMGLHLSGELLPVQLLMRGPLPHPNHP